MALKVLETRATAPEPYRYDEKSDFTGGLNLRADQFNLAPNESPALLNVDVDPRGGVRRRDAVTKINSTAVLGGEIIRLISHYETGQNQVLVAVNDPSTSQSKLQWNDDASGDFEGTVAYGGTDVEFDTTQPPRGVTFNNYTYISNGEMLVSSGHTTYGGVRWSGTNAETALFVPDLDGSDGHFPCARYMATWGDRVWVAYTKELIDGTQKNRVRFSKSGDAENWTATDYFDIDIGEDGDHITGLLPDGDRLLVFKQNSVYTINGFDRDSFQVQNLTRAVGNRDGCDPVWWTNGVFFWYAEDGIYLLTRDSIAWAFERIKPSMTYDVGQPALTLGTAPSMMWFDERLWVSVDYQSDDNLSGSNQNNRRNVFVWDSALGMAGAWTRYDINARSLLAYRPSGDTHLGIAATSGITAPASFDRISKVDQNADVDDYTGTPDEIVSFYHTGWFIGNRPTFIKRWGKTRTVILADNNVTIYQYVYKDYDLSGYTTSFSGSVVGLGSPATWDSDPSGSGTGVWDTSEWEPEGTSDRYLIVRWPTVGTAKAISLRFQVTPTPSYRGKWGVTSIIGMYRTRRLR